MRPLGHFGTEGPGNQVTDQGVRPPGVSGMSAQSADLGACQPGFRFCWGCLSLIHSPGAEGGGAPEARAAVENSLISH